MYTTSALVQKNLHRTSLISITLQKNFIMLKLVGPPSTCVLDGLCEAETNAPFM